MTDARRRMGAANRFRLGLAFPQSKNGNAGIDRWR